MTRLLNYFVLIVFAFCVRTISAQNATSPLAYGWTEILTQVVKNNTTLVAAAEGLKVQQLANKAELALPDPEF